MASITSNGVWNILKYRRVLTLSVKVQSLWKEFDTLSIKEGENIQTCFTRVSNIVNQIRTYEDTIEEVEFVQKVLRNLPPKYDHIVLQLKSLKFYLRFR